MYYDRFIKEWIKRAERNKEIVDDGDRFISLWIAFNGWMKAKYGESTTDAELIKQVKQSHNFKLIFVKLQYEIKQYLDELEEWEIVDMRGISSKLKYAGSFESLIDVLYRIRCNLFHGRKNVSDDYKDKILIKMAYNILLPIFKEYLNKYSDDSVIYLNDT